jgi:hypothetical protein
MSLPSTKESILNLYGNVTLDNIPMQDIWYAWKITEEFKKKTDLFYTEPVKDRVRWDWLAYEVWGNRELWWLLALFNTIEDPFSIYWDKEVDSSVKNLVVLQKTYIPIILEEIRVQRKLIEKIKL